jgi:hypothetical protein
MASILRVNTLTDASSNNSIGMSYVAEGSGKCWVQYNASTAIQDSFNTTSLTDSATGKTIWTIASDMNNDDYAVTTSAANGDASATSCTLDPHTFATGTVSLNGFAGAGTASLADRSHCCAMIMGDLA